MARTAPVPAPAPSPGIRQYEPEPVATHLLQPAPYNPRSIPKDMLEALKAGIRRDGLLDPLVVQRRSEKYGEHVIISGHQRYRAIREICGDDGTSVAALQCIVLDVDDRTAMRINVAMNKVGGEFDPRLLSNVFRAMGEEALVTPDEITLMGFEDDEFARVIKITDPPRISPEEEGDGFGRSVTLPLAFTDTRMRDAVREKLRERAEAAGKMTGEIVFQILSERSTAIPPAKKAKRK